MIMLAIIYRAEQWQLCGAKVYFGIMEPLLMLGRRLGGMV
jgi:hypothetical protein